MSASLVWQWHKRVMGADLATLAMIERAIPEFVSLHGLQKFEAMMRRQIERRLQGLVCEACGLPTRAVEAGARK